MTHEQLYLAGAPTVGFGQVEAIAAPAAVAGAASPWTMVFATSVVSAATGWVLEELVQTVRRRRRR